MVDRPWRIALWITGADVILPSRMIAIFLPMLAEVRSPNCRPP
jgi:hypothetical protein